MYLLQPTLLSIGEDQHREVVFITNRQTFRQGPRIPSHLQQVNCQDLILLYANCQMLRKSSKHTTNGSLRQATQLAPLESVTERALYAGEQQVLLGKRSI